MNRQQLQYFLDKKVDEYNRPSFIERDPISIPHLYSQKRDIEIAGFFAALFAWGNRTIIINKSKDLLQRMDNQPYQFILNHSEQDRKIFFGFKHRTFQDGDILYLIEFLQQHYKRFNSLEDAFLISSGSKEYGEVQENRLRNFYQYAFSFPHLARTEKHIATPAKNSACKRLNMYLRWMVRKDIQSVDFGLWSRIKTSELMVPLDVHVTRVAKKLNLLGDEKANWTQTLLLTKNLRNFDPVDPVKYDFALFGLGVVEKYWA